MNENDSLPNLEVDKVALNKVEHEGRSATHYGTCQACMRQQKAPGGVLAKHGYVVAKYGFFVGTCPGSGQLPFEVSCDYIISRIIPALYTQIDWITKEQEKPFPQFPRVAFWDTVHRYTTEATVVKSDLGKTVLVDDKGELLKYKHNVGYAGLLVAHGEMKKTLAYSLQNLLNSTKGNLKECEHMVDTWKEQPLKKILNSEELYAKKLEKPLSSSEKDCFLSLLLVRKSFSFNLRKPLTSAEKSRQRVLEKLRSLGAVLHSIDNNSSEYSLNPSYVPTKEMLTPNFDTKTQEKVWEAVKTGVFVPNYKVDDFDPKFEVVERFLRHKFFVGTYEKPEINPKLLSF